jgi:hypothetical protein
VAELLFVLVEIIHGVHGATELARIVEILREDPRIGLTLAILLIAGAFVAILIRRARRDELPPLSIRK